MNNPKRCLVLGGRGFIGSHLVDALLVRGHFVRCFDRPHIAPLPEAQISDANFELFEGDFVSDADISEAVDSCEVCFHLISTTLPKSSNADPIFDVESNVVGSLRLLSHLVRSGTKKIIFVSSGGTVYGMPTQLPILETHSTNPMCSYGITKLTIEKYLGLFKELHGLDYTVLRIANPFGERQRTHASQGAIAVFLGKVLRGEPVEIWGDGSVIRDYIHIDDVIDALLAALNHSTSQNTFNIGSGCGHSLNEVLDAIERVTRRTANRHYLPGRPFDVPKSVLSIQSAEDELEWVPRIKFADGLRRFANWIEKNEGLQK
ncbi:NAD-dependent epimerase/dehydratase family protein [Methylomonas sp. UP202]|uniref:NAD-dependent epimerase/dehydratase family protein n=1 Tax=Methylomonas sp. UP202 TaxID=3040943 RepID=UPI00143B14CD|nr:NAD-dependent epimerase/dehydratase family protein [Methylomonas sp. UP202]NJA04842.1 NAD-dependent epimerase/dehydratase family protein [Methylococcaceae bacterium WWC4]WGS87800.1 NAD-dependent epimerase/dehydratase family protein [Methylomonas sp. UP202]